MPIFQAPKLGTYNIQAREDSVYQENTNNDLSKLGTSLVNTIKSLKTTEKFVYDSTKFSQSLYEAENVFLSSPDAASNGDIPSQINKGYSSAIQSIKNAGLSDVNRAKAIKQVSTEYNNWYKTKGIPLYDALRKRKISNTVNSVEDKLKRSNYKNFDSVIDMLSDMKDVNKGSLTEEMSKSAFVSVQIAVQKGDINSAGIILTNTSSRLAPGYASKMQLYMEENRNKSIDRETTTIRNQNTTKNAEYTENFEKLNQRLYKSTQNNTFDANAWRYTISKWASRMTSRQTRELFNQVNGGASSDTGPAYESKMRTLAKGTQNQAMFQAIIANRVAKGKISIRFAKELDSQFTKVKSAVNKNFEALEQYTIKNIALSIGIKRTQIESAVRIAGSEAGLVKAILSSAAIGKDRAKVERFNELVVRYLEFKNEGNDVPTASGRILKGLPKGLYGQAGPSKNITLARQYADMAANKTATLEVAIEKINQLRIESTKNFNKTLHRALIVKNTRNHYNALLGKIIKGEKIYDTAPEIERTMYRAYKLGKKELKDPKHLNAYLQRIYLKTVVADPAEVLGPLSYELGGSFSALGLYLRDQGAMQDSIDYINDLENVRPSVVPTNKKEQ